jgi:hypothetical protein
LFLLASRGCFSPGPPASSGLFQAKKISCSGKTFTIGYSRENSFFAAQQQKTVPLASNPHILLPIHTRNRDGVLVILEPW